MSDTYADIEYLDQKSMKPSFIMQDYGTPNIRHGEYQTHSMECKRCSSA